MRSNDLKGWNRNQLWTTSARLHGQIDGLAEYRRGIYQQIQKTVDDISALEVLRRNIDIGAEQDTLDHLRQRELALREEFKELGEKMETLIQEVELIDYEIAGRPLLDEDTERRIEQSRRDLDKSLKRIRTKHLGVFGRLRAWLFGE